MLKHLRNAIFVGMAVAVITLLSVLSFTNGVEKTKKPPHESDAFFADGVIPQLRIEISPANLEKLRGDPRNYVRCAIHENGKVIVKQAAVKLKGAAGSFRNIDDRPAMSINLDKYEKGQKFHGLDKFHLNNSVQDGTYLNEFIGSELAARAGVPATRVTHARVWINDRDLGVYVLKEGFDKHFLGRYFEKTNGNLYDGGFLQDIDAALQKDAGDGDNNREDLRKLIAACREPDLVKRKDLLEQTLDIDAFLAFVAVEKMCSHWDGYAHNKNNYRVYFDPQTNKAYFFPHGMDQLFGDPNANMFDIPGTIVTSGVLQCPDFNVRYRKKVRELASFFNPPEPLAQKLDAVHQRLRPVLAAINPGLAKQHEDQTRDVKNRLLARGQNLIQQFLNNPLPMEFDRNGMMVLDQWQPNAEGGGAKTELTKSPDGRPAYAILCGPASRYVSSWRCKVLLPPGRYKFHANARVNNIVGIEDPKGTGAGLRMSGENRANKLLGNTDWTRLEFDFEVKDAPREVLLVAEVRATQGEAWFEKDSLKVSKLP